MSRPRRLSLARRLSISLLAVVFLLGIVEGGVRLYALATGTVFFPEWAVFDPVLGYRLQPGFAQPTKGITINRLGFRGREPLGQPGAPTMIFLGDSCVYGHKVSSDEATLPAQLETQLRALQRPLEVINAGVAGYTSIHVRWLFQTRVVGLRPAIVGIYVGWKDIDFAPNLLAEDPPLAYWARQASAWLETKSYAYSWCVWLTQAARQRRREEHIPLGSSQAQASFDLAVVKARCLARYRHHLQAIAASARDAHITLFLVTLPTPLERRLPPGEIRSLLWWQSDWQAFLELHAALNDEIRRLGAEEDLLVVDLDRLVQALPASERLRMFFDAEHASDYGNQVLARMIAKRLLPVLNTGRRP